MLTLLIDGDIIAYRAASATEVPIQWEEDLWTLHGIPSEGYAYADDVITKLIEKAGADSCIVLLSGKANYRKQLYPEYKANRTNTRKPFMLTTIRKWIADHYRTKVSEGIEADDLIGIFATKKPDDYIIWSPDKDLKQIAGKHLTDEGVITITPEEAERNFWIQVLTGDTADNYKGITGVGPVKAERILDKDDGLSSWEKVKQAYEKAGMTVEDAILTARLAHILTYQTKDNLWSPPND